MNNLQLIYINESKLKVTLSLEELNEPIVYDIPLRYEDLNEINSIINDDIPNQYISFGARDDLLDKLKEKGKFLFDTLFTECREFIIALKKHGNPIHLNLFIDFSLHDIPMELLYDGEDFLSDYLIISRHLDSNIPTYTKQKIKSLDVGGQFSLVGDPSKSEDISEDITHELDEISSIDSSNFTFRGPYYPSKRTSVNKITLLELLSSSKYLHFSGHYMHNEKVSGWKLENDIFSADDIKRAQNVPDFVFSNTCGDNHTFLAQFISGFIKKGTKSIICSIGKTPSKKAAEFGLIFYKNLFLKGYNLGEAYYFARKTMIKKYGKNDLFWAFYQLYGSSELEIIIKDDSLTAKDRLRKVFYSFNRFILIIIPIFILACVLFLYITERIDRQPVPQEYEYLSNINILLSSEEINIEKGDIDRNYKQFILNNKVDTLRVNYDVLKFSSDLHHPLVLVVNKIDNGMPIFMQGIIETRHRDPIVILQPLMKQIIVNTQDINFDSCPTIDDSLAINSSILDIFNFHDKTLHVRLADKASHKLNFEIDTANSNITDVVIFKNDFDESLDFHFIQFSSKTGYVWSYNPSSEFSGQGTTIHIPSHISELKEREYTDYNFEILYENQNPHYLFSNYKTFFVYLDK